MLEWCRKDSERVSRRGTGKVNQIMKCDLSLRDRNLGGRAEVMEVEFEDAFRVEMFLLSVSLKKKAKPRNKTKIIIIILCHCCSQVASNSNVFLSLQIPLHQVSECQEYRWCVLPGLEYITKRCLNVSRWIKEDLIWHWVSYLKRV